MLDFHHLVLNGSKKKYRLGLPNWLFFACCVMIKNYSECVYVKLTLSEYTNMMVFIK